MTTRNAYDELAAELQALARREARVASPPVGRWKVLKANPLTVEDIGSETTIAEGDDDVEIDRALLTTRPAVGDTVRVHHDGQDYVIAGVIE